MPVMVRFYRDPATAIGAARDLHEIEQALPEGSQAAQLLLAGLQ
jgi:hypothetical protein